MTKKKKKKKIIEKDTYFFAYQSAEKSNNCDNVDAIRATATSLGNIAVTWEKMKINGKLINRQILAEIDKAEVFACDLTYLNANVFFELGYAIGKGKRLFVMLNNRVKHAASNYSDINILKGIGYTSFSNAEDLKREINSNNDNQKDSTVHLIDQLKQLAVDDKGSIDIFYIKSSTNSQAEMDTIDYIKNSQYTQICDDSYEIAYETLDWYLDSLNKCNNLIIHLSGADKIMAEKDNAKNSLYAGLGLAMGKRVLFVAPKPYYAPIDYNDMLLEYNSSKECVEKIINWIPKPKKSSIKYNTPEDIELNLLKLGIGYSIAEDEKTALLSYFVETHAYNLALKSRSSIFYGRKGTGKTAIYIKLNDYFNQLENTYLIGLKPESTELMDNIHAATLYTDFASKKSLFHSVWKFVLYSKLLLNIYDHILKTSKLIYIESEQNIIDYCNDNSDKLQLNFLATLSQISDESKEQTISTSQTIERYHKFFLLPMLVLITDYFKKTKFYKVAIIADNLDKAWDADADLSMQTEMILSLLEVTGKLQLELIGKSLIKIDTTTIIFLRSDIYKFIINKSREPDKLTVNSHEIEWNSCRPLIKSLVEKRIECILEIDTKDELSSIWKTYFDFGRDDPMVLVQIACLPRPRDIILFFGKMFESACNNSRTKVSIEDYEYAIENYSNFLYQNLVAEMSAEYSYIRDMIWKLHSQFVEKIELGKFRTLVNEYENDKSKADLLIGELFSNEYLIATDINNNEKYLTYQEVISAESDLNSKKRRFFTKSHIYIIQHPRYARMKI